MREVIQYILAPDGRTRVSICQRSDGRYEYSHDKFYVDDVSEYGHHVEYWSPGQPSGIFDSFETAKREALVEFPWITGTDGGIGA